MYKMASVNSGLPPRLYRTPEQIKKDISDILAKSLRVRELFSVREMLAAAMDDAASGRIDELYEISEEILEAVSEAKDELSELDRELCELKCEVISVMNNA